jgi:hypothetical protein
VIEGDHGSRGFFQEAREMLEQLEREENLHTPSRRRFLDQSQLARLELPGPGECCNLVHPAPVP